jgi:carboxymethylenebutenolidase
MYVTPCVILLISGVVFSEIYQVTGPVERFASNVASEGYVVALPSSFHEFEGPEAIPYDTDGTDRGNKYKACSSVENLLASLMI